MEHVNTPINEIVMYQSAEQVIRPPTPFDVSVCKGNHVMLFFSVSRCVEALCQKTIQLLVQGMVACA